MMQERVDPLSIRALGIHWQFHRYINGKHESRVSQVKCTFSRCLMFNFFHVTELLADIRWSRFVLAHRTVDTRTAPLNTHGPRGRVPDVSPSSVELFPKTF